LNLQYELPSYAAELEEYIEHERLPIELFDEPDHVAIKAANGRHFEKWIESLQQGDIVEVNQIYCTVIKRRRIATAFTAGPIAIGNLGEADLLEVIEMRPDKKGIDKVGLDHVAFKTRLNLSVIAQNLITIQGISLDRQAKAKLSNLCLTFGPQNREFKLTDRSLKAIILEEHRKGETEKIYDRSSQG
jgi:hypothetical protein